MSADGLIYSPYILGLENDVMRTRKILYPIQHIDRNLNLNSDHVAEG
jgi:hypothetical protein